MWEQTEPMGVDITYVIVGREAKETLSLVETVLMWPQIIDWKVTQVCFSIMWDDDRAKINHLHTASIWGNIKNRSVFIIISWQWDGTCGWNHSSWKTRTCSSHRVNNMAADDLAPCIARSSTAMTLSQCDGNISASAQERLNFTAVKSISWQGNNVN